MLKTKVILSHVTNLSDARYASGMGVDYIGFAIDPENDRYVTVEQAKTICDWLSGVAFISEIGNSAPANITDYSATTIQTSNASLVDKLDKPILEIKVNHENIDSLVQILVEHTDQVHLFIITVEAENLSALQPMLSEVCGRYPIYLSTDFNNENLAFVLSEINPTGIVLHGGDEEKPGLSSYDGIANILELLAED